MPIQFTWAEVFNFYEKSEMKEMVIKEIGQAFSSLSETAQRRELKHASREMYLELLPFLHKGIRDEHERENFWNKRLNLS